MDEGNFNLAGNLFHNILRLYLIHLCPKVLPGQLLDVPKFVCVRPGSLQRSLRPLAAFEGTLCGRKGEKAVRGERKEREGNERGEGKEGETYRKGWVRFPSEKIRASANAVKSNKDVQVYLKSVLQSYILLFYAAASIFLRLHSKPVE